MSSEIHHAQVALFNTIVDKSVLLFYYMPEYLRQLGQDWRYNVSVSYIESSMIDSG